MRNGTDAPSLDLNEQIKQIKWWSELNSSVRMLDEGIRTKLKEKGAEHVLGLPDILRDSLVSILNDDLRLTGLDANSLISLMVVVQEGRHGLRREEVARYSDKLTEIVID